KKETKLLVKTTTSPYGLSLYDNDQIVYALYKKELTDFNTKNLSKSLLSEKFTKILTLACNYKSNILALGSKNGFLQLLNLCEHKNLMNATFTNPIYSLSLHPTNNKIAIGLKNGAIHFFTHHAYPTTKQLMLRKILYLWLQCKKPNKKIKNPKILLINIAHLFKIRYTELFSTWNSFPPCMQRAIWENMHKLIKKYGK